MGDFRHVNDSRVEKHAEITCHFLDPSDDPGSTTSLNIQLAYAGIMKVEFFEDFSAGMTWKTKSFCCFMSLELLFP